MRETSQHVPKKHFKLGRTFMKGALSVALAGALTAAVPFGSAFAEYRGFSDLEPSHWAVTGGTVDWSQERGVINGYPDGSWAPDATIDRAQAATVVWNYAGSPAPQGTAEQFIDVTESDWFADAALWCREEGVFAGVGDTGYLDPYAPITREQVAAVLLRYADGAEGSADDYAKFPDASSVSSWAEGAMGWAVANSVLTGAVTESGQYANPQSSCTRAEFVTMLARTVDGAMQGVDLTGKKYVVDATYVPEYETVEVPVYEQQWVPDTVEKECVRFYCRWCGFDNGCVIPLDEFFASDFVDSDWFWIRNEVFGHVERNDCGCPPEIGVDPDGAFDGSIGKSRGTGQQTLTKSVENGSGHWEQVQTGTETQRIEVGGHWEYGEGRWE